MLKKAVLPSFIVIALIVVIRILWWGYDDPHIGIDDANIYFVYMRNVADGHGFVWNIGGEHVEGFTSLLWTLVGAAAYKLSAAHFTQLLFAIAFLLTFATIYKSLRFVRKLNGESADTFVASDLIIVSLLLFSLGFIDWNILSLMETGLWTFLLTSIMINVCNFTMTRNYRDIRMIALYLVFLDLTRPESIAFGLLFTLLIFLVIFLEEGVGKAIRAAALPLFAHAVTIGTLMIWRISYFGYPFPNTYYAKVSARFSDNLTGGIPYLFTFFYGYPVTVLAVCLLLIFCALILLKWKKQQRFSTLEAAEKIELLLSVVIFAGLLLPVTTGGDHFKYSRFYQPLLPILYIALCNTASWKGHLGMVLPTNRVTSLAIAGAIFATSVFTSKFSFFEFIAAKQHVVHYPVIGDFEVARLGREAGARLNETFDDTGNYPSVGVLGTGAVGFAYKGKIIDLLGLNNTIMAHATKVKTGMRNHAAFDKNAFYTLKPDMMGTFYGGDVVVTDTASFVMPENLVSFRTDNTNMVYTCYKQIYDDSTFHDVYIPALIRNRKRDFYLFNYFHRDYLRSINPSKFVVKILKRKFKAVD